MTTEERRTAYLARAAEYRAFRLNAQGKGLSTKVLRVPTDILLEARDLGYKLREVSEQLGVAYGTIRQTASSAGVGYIKSANRSSYPTPTAGRRKTRHEDARGVMRHVGIDPAETSPAIQSLECELVAVFGRFDRARIREQGVKA